jgi:hypothetical protein
MTALLAALRMAWPYLACVAIGFSSAWYIQANRYEAKISAIELQIANDKTEAVNDAFRQTTTWQGIADAARKQGDLRVAVAQRNTVVARAAVDSLRNDAADLPRRIANASRAAVDQYAAAANGLLNDCSRKYQELAATATGHANDVRTLSDSWPR